MHFQPCKLAAKTLISQNWKKLIMSMMTLVFQSPTSLRNTHITTPMATNQQPHLGMGRKGMSKSIKVYTYTEVVTVANCNKLSSDGNMQ